MIGNQRVNKILCRNVLKANKKINTSYSKDIQKIKFDFNNDFTVGLKGQFDINVGTKSKFESEFSRKYHLREIEKYYSVFLNEKYNKYNNKYLSNLYELLSKSRKHYALQRLDIKQKKSNSVCNSTPPMNESMYKRTTLSSRVSLVNRSAINSDISKYDILTEHIGNKNNNSVANNYKESIIGYKCKDYSIKKSKIDNIEDNEDNDDVFKREEFYKYYDEPMMNDYGKMFINLSRNVFFYKNNKSNHSRLIKYMKELSFNHEKSINKKLPRSYSERKIIKIKKDF